MTCVQKTIKNKQNEKKFYCYFIHSALIFVDENRYELANLHRFSGGADG
ncbi:p5.6 [Bean yellow disorder virus]|uniref:p5.6 n=1 Tax=Bean yellow disorder virus TaxID=267970 RepID=B2BZW5_9CLOS|nr:p5.6 [Bean yellow disorder virus]ABY66964.1 p5.6 [Bean yellow disorder virus]